MTDLSEAHEEAMDKFAACMPHKIVNGYCDPEDIHQRVDDMACLTAAYLKLMEVYAADLNDNVSATSKVDVTEFKTICNETFNDLACAFERVAREIGEDFRGGPRRSRVVYLRN